MPYDYFHLIVKIMPDWCNKKLLSLCRSSCWNCVCIYRIHILLPVLFATWINLIFYFVTHLQGIPVILVITGVSLMVLDPKHLTMKYRIELQYVKQLSMSTFSDQIFVVHIDPVSLSQSVSLSLSLSSIPPSPSYFFTL